jgi:hypothetical protein
MAYGRGSMNESSRQVSNASRFTSSFPPEGPVRWDRFNRPARRGYFPRDSRHVVTGYYRAVPPGQNHSSIEAPRNYPSAYGVETLGNVQNKRD